MQPTTDRPEPQGQIQPRAAVPPPSTSITLLTLPTEIRECIYKHLLEDMFLYGELGPNLESRLILDDGNHVDLKKPLGVLFSCQQIYHELLPVIAASLPIVVNDYPLFDYEDAMLRLSGSYRHHVRHLVVKGSLFHRYRGGKVMQRCLVDFFTYIRRVFPSLRNVQFHDTCLVSPPDVTDEVHSYCFTKEGPAKIGQMLEAREGSRLNQLLRDDHELLLTMVRNTQIGDAHPAIELHRELFHMMRGYFGLGEHVCATALVLGSSNSANIKITTTSAFEKQLKFQETNGRVTDKYDEEQTWLNGWWGVLRECFDCR